MDAVKDRFPAPPDEAVYHGIIGEHVRALTDYTEADPIAVLGHDLVFLGNVVGRERYMEADGAHHHGNLFTVFVGKTSKARKGTAKRRSLGLLKYVDPDWAARCVQGGLVSGEGVIHAVRDRVEEASDDPSVPSRVVDPGVSDKRCQIIEEEFASVLKIATRQGNVLGETIRQAYDSGDLQIMSRNSPCRALGAHISIIGHITQDELKRTLTTADTNNGFANRIVWLSVKRSQLLPHGGNPPQTVMNLIEEKMRRAIAFAKQFRPAKFTAAAYDRWSEIYRELSEERPGIYGALTARGEAHTLRIALVYAMLDHRDDIDVPHLEAALALWRYSERSVKHIFGDLTGDADADAILSALRDRPPGMTRTEISNRLGRNVTASRIEAALTVLYEYRLAEFSTRKGPGRPIERWKAVAEKQESIADAAA